MKQARSLPVFVLCVLCVELLAIPATSAPVRHSAKKPKPAVKTTVSAPVASKPIQYDLSPPLIEMARHVKPVPVTETEEEESGGGGKASRRAIQPKGATPSYMLGRILPRGILPLLGGPNPATLRFSFDGLTTADVGVSNFATDSTGAIGPNHYVESANFSYTIYDRAGNRLLGPFPTGAFWNGFAAAPCGGNWSDVVILYDRTADRWFVSRFAQASGGEWFQCFAISQTPDPTQQYFRYAYQISATEFNDYPKFGIWPDAYYMTAQRNKIFPGLGLFVAAFERSKMLTGDSSAQMVLFTLNNNGNRAGMLPADWDGHTPPPAGTPNYLIRPLSSQLGWPNPDSLEIWAFHVDFTNTSNSTLAVTDTLLPDPYTPACLFNQNCVPQPNPSTLLDPLASGYLMYRLAYRNFGDHEALVVNQTVDNGDLAPAVHVGVRWYELRRSGGAWSIFQQSTHVPDSDHRWIGSMAMDQQGNIALGYNVSGSDRNPSLAFASRLATDPLNTMSQETTIQEGGGSQTGFIFWGDYSQMTLDPVDDCTFWYVGAYQPADSTQQDWSQRIASMRFPGCPLATTSLTYSGSTSQDYHDPVTLSGNLFNTFANFAAPGQTVTFNLGAQSCNAVTDGLGNVSCSLVPNQAAGSYPLTAAFAGTDQMAAANFTGTFTIKHEETSTTYTGPKVVANGFSTQLSGVLKEDGATPISGRTLTFTLGSGATAQSCSGVTNGGGSAFCSLVVNQPLGPDVVSATFAGDADYLPSSDSANTIMFAFLASGSFVIGDQSAAGAVTFWSSDWGTVNALSGGAAPNAFKGFANTLSAEPPACGMSWVTGPGNSSQAPSTVPSYMGVLVASGVGQSGSSIGGNTAKIVVVQTAPGYSNNPGHPGTGVVVANVCP